MIGPPNNGAVRANLWADSTVGRELFRFVIGDAGQQLGPRFHEIKDAWPRPTCEFGIIAGGKGDGARLARRHSRRRRRHGRRRRNEAPRRGRLRRRAGPPHFG